MITDFRINAKGELEGKVIPLAKWEEMYTKDEVIAMFTDLDLQIDESAAYNLEVAKVQRLIRDKIDKLKGEETDAKKIH